MNPLYSKLLGSAIRALMSAVGGAMLDDETVEQLVGALMVIGSIAWSYYNHRRGEAKRQAALDNVVMIRPASDRKPFRKIDQ